MMNLVLIVLASVVAAASADCDACIDGWCHSKKTLIQGFHISDQMAIDRLHHVLYIQLNSNTTTTIFADDLKIQQLAQASNMSAITVDQDTQIIYMTDPQRNVYKYEQGIITIEESITLLHEVTKMLFHKGNFYYLTKFWNSNVILNTGIGLWYHVEDYPITDFVVDKDDDVYFVANDTVYVMNRFNYGRPVKVTCSKKNYVLSTDNYGDVYFGDASSNAIYKINNETNELVLYAAYQTGSVGEFVFDNVNNIVFRDSAAESISLWKPSFSRCDVGTPHVEYNIKEVPYFNTLVEPV